MRIDCIDDVGAALLPGAGAGEVTATTGALSGQPIDDADGFGTSEPLDSCDVEKRSLREAAGARAHLHGLGCQLVRVDEHSITPS
jgi:hypothetical protein